jgi:hypothetical protein
MTESANSSTKGNESPSTELIIPNSTPKNYISKRFKNLIECFPCSIEDCQILFETQKDLDNHSLTHKKLFKCKYPGCQKSFMQLVNLQKHNKSHFKNKKIYFCPFKGCNKSFTASYSVTLHYRVHTGNKPFKCEICEKKFFDKANWQYHVNNMHKKIIEKKLICQHINCGHKSKSQKQLLMHHDKLEEECVKEKNLLLKLIMLYQKASVDLLENKEDSNLNKVEDKVKDKFEDNLGIDDENKTIWINYINNYDLDDELKNYSKLIELQSQQVIENSTDYDKYVGILSN